MDKKTIITAALLMTLLFPCFTQSEYRVQPGDTVYGVSRRFDVDPNLLMRINGIDDPSRLKAGQLLKIPGSYEVQPGDTYFGIARKLGVPLKELLELNRRTEESLLLAGDTLQIPSDARTALAPSTAGTASGTAAGTSAAVSAGTAGSPSAGSEEKAPGNAETPGSYFWPHSGQMSALSGKLQGAQFDGQQGDPVFSVSSGKVIWVAPYRGYNKLIIVESPDTHIFAYGGNDICLVSVGDQVFPGMEIGRLGINPHEGEAKAFFFVYKNGTPVDPEKAPRT